MLGVVSRPGTEEKLQILSADAQYDLACACGSRDEERRRRGASGKWVYPVTLPNGGKSTLFKTLLSNSCTSDCKYCPLRDSMDVRRCTLNSEEITRVFLDYFNRGEVFGLFLSSAVCGSPDSAMERLNAAARILRNKHKYRGYIHLKVIPGASDAAIEEAVSLATAVSLNIETPGAQYMARLSSKKQYIRDIIEPIKLISRLTARGARYSRVKQTTQFIVGAAGESDAEIVKYMGGLYERLRLQRIYFSAYQKGLGHETLPGEQTRTESPTEIFTREHRLYQVDFLLRKYGFRDSDIVYENDGRLSLSADPKETWAKTHPEAFPINVNRASKFDLLKVPGLGPITVSRILARRQEHRLHGIEDMGRAGALLRKAASYITF
jgi:predicted DNA-binding helix-hairpin-helix protein